MVGPAAAQATPEPAVATTPYDVAIVALVGVIVAVLGIGGTVLVRTSSSRMIADIVVSVLEVAVKLTPSTTDDAEVAKLRAELEKLKAALPPTVTGADVSRDEVEADG